MAILFLGAILLIAADIFLALCIDALAPWVSTIMFFMTFVLLFSAMHYVSTATGLDITLGPLFFGAVGTTAAIWGVGHFVLPRIAERDLRKSRELRYGHPTKGTRTP